MAEALASYRQKWLTGLVEGGIGGDKSDHASLKWSTVRAYSVVGQNYSSAKFSTVGM